MKYLLALTALAVLAQAPSPRLATVTPDTGKAGAEYVGAGEHLTKAAFRELLLTDGKDDIKVRIITQKEDAIQFQVPAGTKPGRCSLMFLSADGKQYLEQPVKLTIE